MAARGRASGPQASAAKLKSAGNELFQHGRYGEAAGRYSEAIVRLQEAGTKWPEELSVLYSNRAACYLKIGSCSDSIKDCTASLELVPFALKPLIRRATAYEALERYPQAFVDFRTATQLDGNVQAAQDGMNRMRKVLTERDGNNWRDNLPPIPSVPATLQRKWRPNPPGNTGAETATIQQNGDGTASASLVQARSLKEAGNALVKKGEHRKAVEKYSESLRLNSKEYTTFTNRALCYLNLQQYREAEKDCTSALGLDPANLKAFYRRAQARKEQKNYKGSLADLQEMLKLDPNNAAGQRLVQDIEKLVK
ncbi:mitochondrial import receptor subunit TOM34 [Leucoraja erinacea]|uniref:mitochondrial import receptor subunit TOM34 n=1 Tax=Leucoraja erinaceus TaxID=7782 RepID=UPI002456B636|nr:mitochondrial import receptor subunit TOM34 [Leucoraja erinacea]